MALMQTRREFLTALSLAGPAGLLSPPRVLAAERELETTTVRLAKGPGICIAPQYVAEELLRAEGFTEIRYVEKPAGATRARRDRFRHELCVELRQGDRCRRADHVVGRSPCRLFGIVRKRRHPQHHRSEGKERRGPSLGVEQPRAGDPAGRPGRARPVKDIHWVTEPSVKPIERFVEGKIDAFLGFPPEPQDLRARHIGHVIVNTAVDRPWSQYFCCLLGGNVDYVRMHPVATKRVLRAILKAADLCASDPARAARRLVDGGFTGRYDYALQTLTDNPYDKWREYDPEDTIRFYALRLHEVGFIKSSPQKIIADHTDWRFLDELKRELKV
jgi:NitT/TauT family transport system substrate-binding protein